MFGIGETELVIIVVFAFLLFGPDKLPTMGRTIGRGLRQFREAQDGFTKVVQAEFVDPMNAVSSGAAQGKPSASDDDFDADAAKRAPSETFAQRKRRMEARAAAKSENEADKSQEVADATQDELAEEIVDEASAQESVRTAAALYGLSRRSSRDSEGLKPPSASKPKAKSGKRSEEKTAKKFKKDTEELPKKSKKTKGKGGKSKKTKTPKKLKAAKKDTTSKKASRSKSRKGA